MKLNHKQKVKLARKLQAPNEQRRFFGIFQSRAWILRSAAIRDRVSRQGVKKESV